MGNSNPPRDIDAARGVDSVRMRRWTWVVMAVLLAVGAAAHVRYWYLPRERSASPAAGSAAAVWSGAPLPLRVWIPYPHQNLAGTAGLRFALFDPKILGTMNDD